MTEQRNDTIHLDIETAGMTDRDYMKLWQRLDRIEIRCIEKNGQCRHNVGETHYYDLMPYRRPEGVCYALLHVLELYTWRVTLGFPGWDAANRDVYTVHCPDRTGTVWEVRRVPRQAMT